MKVSELIQKLQGAQLLWGDLEVVQDKGEPIHYSVDSVERGGQEAVLLGASQKHMPWLKYTDMDLHRLIEDFDFSVRTINALRAEGIVFLGDLVSHTRTELLKTPNLGKKGLDDIERVLADNGYSLGMRIENWRQG
jgi:DNA-directed RNA polymerase alpha subunit